MILDLTMVEVQEKLITLIAADGRGLKIKIIT